ncbi:MAG: NAD(P)/FAD-dependent oxidoreductase [Propionibacteriales bacterium]|nr:NAD(P)/FAD-dependent oxidoreductase [Propionibacteriales bacterium]
MNMRTRVVIVGGGHNALVSATYLARAGFTTTVLERLPHVGGAAVSVRPFDGVDAKLSRYSYLVSLMPEALIADLGLNLELRSRDTASYTPYEGPHGPAGLLIESAEGEATRQSFRKLTGGDREYEAWTKFYGDVGTLADTIALTLLDPLPEIARLREQVDASLWRELIEEPLGNIIESRFKSDLVRGIVATDALIGTFASLNDERLTQNRCFLYHLIGNGTGEWRVPVGGMGAVTGELERVAREAGAEIRTGTTVTSIDAREDGVTVSGGGFEIEADWVLSGVAPYVLAGLLGDPLPKKPQGSQFKANILVTRLPRLRSGADPEVAFAGTLHLNESYGELEDAYREATDGEVPAHLPGEIYCHTLTDPSILGDGLAASGAHTMTYFGLHTPADVLAGPQQTRLAWHRFLDSLNSHLTEPIEDLFVTDERGQPCVESKTPWEIEHELAMPGGHIFHGDLSWPWLEEGDSAETPAEKWGVATCHPRILLAGSGAVRGGAVSGIAGHNAARALLDYYRVQTG